MYHPPVLLSNCGTTVAVLCKQNGIMRYRSATDFSQRRFIIWLAIDMIVNEIAVNEIAVNKEINVI